VRSLSGFMPSVPARSWSTWTRSTRWATTPVPTGCQRVGAACRRGRCRPATCHWSRCGSRRPRSRCMWVGWRSQSTSGATLPGSRGRG
jgi:hypothetical protein